MYIYIYLANACNIGSLKCKNYNIFNIIYFSNSEY